LVAWLEDGGAGVIYVEPVIVGAEEFADEA
jgi:hypothetical protein